jgi:hypothetical protein
MQGECNGKLLLPKSLLVISPFFAHFRRFLLRRSMKAIRYADILEESGRSKAEAIEIASEVILTPADGPAFQDNPPRPLPYKKREQIYRKLEAREIAEQRRKERGRR